MRGAEVKVGSPRARLVGTVGVGGLALPLVLVVMGSLVGCELRSGGLSPDANVRSDAETTRDGNSLPDATGTTPDGAPPDATGTTPDGSPPDATGTTPDGSPSDATEATADGGPEDARLGLDAADALGPPTDGATQERSSDGSSDPRADAPIDAALEAGPDAAADARADLAVAADLAADLAVEAGADVVLDAAADVPAADVPSACPPTTIGPLPPHAARSGGYAGTLSAYDALYNVNCVNLADCADACVTAGGTRQSCTQGSECISGSPGQPRHCLPPTYWRYAANALTPDTTELAEQTLVVIAYQDPFVLTDFRVAVPAGSQIRGIQFDVRRSADAQTATDESIRILRNGQPVGADRRRNEAWTSDLAYVTYGGPTDTWGETWTAADLQSDLFGIAIAARYTDVAGNARAYIDFARVTVTYVPAVCGR